MKQRAWLSETPPGTVNRVNNSGIQRTDFGKTVFTPGDSIGPFRVTAVIARARAGVVVRARNARHGNFVALKVMPEAGPASKAAIARALQAAPIEHPNLVRVIDAGRHGTTDIIASELMEGLPLTRFLDASVSTSKRQALSWLRDIAAGVAHAHEAGIEDVGLKASSVFITPAGAKVSPCANPHPDFASDEYAWAILATELLTDTAPPKVQTMIRAALGKHAPPMAAIRDVVQAALEAMPEPTPEPVVESKPPPPRAATILPPPRFTEEHLRAALRRDIVESGVATYRKAEARIVLVDGAQPGRQRYSIEVVVEVGARRHSVTASAAAHALVALLVKENARTSRAWTFEL
jgi:hypothetical protein